MTVFAGGGNMDLYLRPFRLFAIYMDFNVDKDCRTLYSAEKYKNEWVIDLPFVSVVWTPRSELKREKSYEYGNKNNKSPKEPNTRRSESDFILHSDNGDSKIIRLRVPNTTCSVSRDHIAKPRNVAN